VSQFLVGSAVTPLTGAMPAGTTIVNNSGVSAVWIDSTPGVSPGLGVRLGPKGSMSWGSAGAPAYAILDTGSTVPATLSVSSDVATIDNPVDVGVSVALQLANQPLSLTTGTQNGIAGAIAGQQLNVGGTVMVGAPITVGNTLALDAATKTGIGAAVGAQALTLAAGTQNGIAGAINAAGVPNTMTGAIIPYTNFANTVDVSAYSSVILGGISQPGVLSYYFFSDAAGTKTLGSRQFVISGAGAFNFSAAVVGPYFRLIGPAISSFVMYGTNRDHGDVFYGATPGAKVASTQAWTASGTSVPIGSFFPTNGGQHYVRLVTTGGGKGFLTFSSIDQAGAPYNAVSIHTGMADPSPSPVTPALNEVQRIVIFPPGLIQLNWLSYTAATYQVIAEVTPIT
jgi:hypothetical protein